METIATATLQHAPWNKGKLISQKKTSLKLKDIWAIRIRLQLANDLRELAMFNLALPSKLRACDLVRLKLTDICHGSQISHRTSIMQKKTGQAVQFEITEQTRESLQSHGQRVDVAEIRRHTSRQEGLVVFVAGR